MLDCVEERREEFLRTVPILALILLVTIYYYNRRRNSRDVRRSRRRDGERLSRVRVVRKNVVYSRKREMCIRKCTGTRTVRE